MLKSLHMCVLAIGIALLALIGASPSTATLPGQNGPLLLQALQGPIDEPGTPTYVSHLYRLSEDGSFFEYDLPNSNYDPALSPDGKKLAYVRNPGDQVWLADIGPLMWSTQITFDIDYDGDYRSGPVFAPDGKSVVFATMFDMAGRAEPFWELRQIQLDTGKQTVTTRPWVNYYNPDLSPDGGLVAFSVFHAGLSEIRLARRVGAPHWRFPSEVPALGPSFSPDGKEIAFTGLVGGVWQIFVGKVKGSGERQLTFGGSSKNSVKFSPDGTKLAYQTEIEDQVKIIIRDLASEQTTSITPPGENALLAEWPRAALFSVLGFKTNPNQLRVRVFGSGEVQVRAGGNTVGHRTVSRRGAYKIGIKRGLTGKNRMVRVVFRPVGALPGSVRYRLEP